MAVQPISANYNMTFTGKKEKPVKAPVLKEVKDHGDFEERIYQTEASIGKKWGVGLASTALPGLGQAINGQWGKGIAFLLGAGAAIFGNQFAISKGKFPLAIAAGVAAIGINIASIVDAVKNAKSTATQIVQKSE